MPLKFSMMLFIIKRKKCRTRRIIYTKKENEKALFVVKGKVINEREYEGVYDLLFSNYFYLVRILTYLST